ncbi:MAG: stage III sporulation protein AB [Firmicutes bacterium]|nr:stage III sporulation protein AB [Bacillota bacterium]MDH7495064.1 stage III sporulation protein AB [Bacillota bacterium]
MLRFLGAALVVGSAALIGNQVARNYAERPRELADISSSFAHLQTEISYARTPLAEALTRACGSRRGAGARIFRAAADLIRGSELLPGEAWRAAVLSVYGWSALAAEDRDVLLAFGETLGACGAEDQLRHVVLARERLRENEARARDEAERMARMWRYLGVTVGAMVALLLY